MTRPQDGLPGSRWSATDAAGYIFERLADGLNSLDPSGLGGRPDPNAITGRPAVESLKVRASLARSMDTYGYLLQNVLASFASEVTQAITVEPGGVDQPTPVTLAGRAGSTAGAILWIHNTSAAYVPEFTLRMTDLSRADGSHLSADLGAIDPVTFEGSLESRRSAWVSFQVPDETCPGYYYGHLIARGLLDAAVPLRLVVR